MGERSFGEKPGIMWTVVLSEGRGLRARMVRPDEWQGIALPPVPFREAGGQEGAMLGVSVMPPFRACGARPSRGTIQGKMALWGKARTWRQGWFSRRGAVSAPGWCGRTNGKALRCDRCLSERPVAKKGQYWG